MTFHLNFRRNFFKGFDIFSLKKRGFKYVFLKPLTNQDVIDRVENNNNEMTILINQLIEKCDLIKEGQDSLIVSNLNTLDEVKKSHANELAILKETLIEEMKNLLKTRGKEPKFDVATSLFSEVNV